MAEDQDVQRTLGAHEARLTRLEADNLDLRKTITDFRTEVRADAAATSVKLGAIHDAVTSFKGGWKALGAVGGIVTIISGVAIALYHFVFAK